MSKSQIAKILLEISVSSITQEYNNVLQLIIQFPLHNYLSTGRLQEVKSKRKFQNFSVKSGRGRLQEVLNTVI